MEKNAPASQTTRPSRLYRSRDERKLFGVCGGLGMYLGLDPTLVRILFVISAFASFGITLLAYIIMAIVVPGKHSSASVTGAQTVMQGNQS
jgi:phage shock protein C